jgi:cytochrome b6-f complex iron-sulfur subunit
MVLVSLAEPVPHALSYASGVLVLLALVGWVLEARDVAGPAPEVEPEHEEEEHAPGPSYWPVVLALGVVGIAAGLVYDWEYGSLIVAVPLGLAAAAAWGSVLRREMTPTPERAAVALAGPALVTASGRVLMPVSGRELAARAAAGAAIAIEEPGVRQVSRRGLLRVTFWSGLTAGLAVITASIVDFLYPRGVTGFGGVVNVKGTTDQYPPGSKTAVPEGRFWLVNLTADQGGPGFLALWWKCPHLGCTVPWRPNFVWPDPATGQEEQGWFRCPCHGSTYDNAGVRVYGPAPRSMDRFELTIDSSKRISVNTGSVEKGTPDNASFAVEA